MVWLTGGALAAALAMILVLLGFIFYQGVITFWPAPLVELHLYGGRNVLGEIVRAENFRPEDSFFTALEPSVAETVRRSIEATGGETRRQLVRTGNFELTNTHFEWIDDALVAEWSTPEWAVTVERVSWGRFYGWPRQFLIDGKPVAATSDEVWRQFERHHPEVRERWRQRRRLEERMGRINDAVEEARLELRGSELRGGRDTPRWQLQSQRLADAQAEAERRFAEIGPEMDRLEQANARFQMVLSTADGQQATLALADMVRAYPANRLGVWGKLGVYLSRWQEFLTDEPREANSEGGVYPAIFGTVLMTLVMTLAVVPFGVLAALYLREYSKGGLVVMVVRIAINNLAGVPSIVFGVFGLGFFCYIVGGFIDHGPTTAWRPGPWFVWLAVLIVVSLAAILFSAAALKQGDRTRKTISRLTLALWLASIALLVVVLAHAPFFHGFFAARSAAGSPTFGKGGLIWASLTLALLTLPVVIVATEEALAAVPRSMREGSYACGAGKWQTIRRIVLPRAMPGIMTGMILAMARGAGEVAPLMLVGAAKLAPKLPLDTTPPFLHPQRSFMHLGFQVFDLGFQSPNSEAAKPMVFTTTLLLIAIIAMLNLAAVWLRTRFSRRFAGSHF